MTMPLLLWICALLSPAAASITTITWSKNQSEALAHTIYTGDIVNWVWGDDFPHSVHSTDARFQSSTVVAELGYNYSVQFWGSGVFPYECMVHATMRGSITVVVEADEPTSSPTAFSTAAPDLSTPLIAPKLVKSGQVLPAKWSLRMEVRPSRVVVNKRVSFNTRTYCILDDCRLTGPTIQAKAGDVLRLIIANHLGSNANSSDPTLPQPNTTQFYMHGLHISPSLSFQGVRPGTTEEFELTIPTDHTTGMHWYSSDTPGAAELHAMSGLVGAFYIEPQRVDAVPFAIQNAVAYVMLVTRLVVVQETERSSGEVTQGCSLSSVCDASFQSPLCSGTESVSPYNPYRLYCIDELSTEAGSTFNVNLNLNGTDAKDLTLINGQSVPTVNMVNKNPFIFKIINAGTGGSLRISLPANALRCTGTVIAVDGVYLQARWSRSTVNLPPGSRADVEMFCDFTGTYTLYESGNEFLHIRVAQSTSNRPPVKDNQLEGIRRPAYMSDLREENASTIDRYFSIDMSLRSINKCNYQIGFGMNCLNETVVFDENASYPQFDYDCTYDMWTGSRGADPFDYVLSNRFVTFVDAINQWTIYGGRTAFQTFAMRVNHFQIMSMSSNETENDWFQVGQYRDTLPLVVDSIVIRFVSADFTGEHTFQSNFIRHKELGVKESYLVVNYSNFQSLTQFPTQSPTGTPDDGIIQVLSFQMAVAFGVAIIVGVVIIAVYLTFFTESRNTVFPDKVM